MAAPEAVIATIFSKMDSDGDGTISCGEMDTCFNLFDKDGDGKVSAAEWNSGFASNFNGTPAQAEKIYKYLDKAGSGQIDVGKLHDLFKAMDSDGNGKVSKDEFHAFWMKLLA